MILRSNTVVKKISPWFLGTAFHAFLFGGAFFFQRALHQEAGVRLDSFDAVWVSVNHAPAVLRPEPHRALDEKIPENKSRALASTPFSSDPTASAPKTVSGTPSENHGPIAYFQPEPQIPDELKRDKVQTQVVVEFIVSENSSTQVKLLESSGSDELDRIAMSAARKWKFHPAEKDGMPVPATARLNIRFHVI